MNLETFTEKALRRLRRIVRHPTDREVRAASGCDPRTIKTFTQNRELRTLHNLANDMPRGGFGIEIGSYLGASTLYIASAMKKHGATLYCVDTWNNETMPEGTRDTYAIFQQNLGALHGSVRTIRKSSNLLVPEDVPHKISFAFIDGDHSYEAVKSDFAFVSAIATRDAVVAFHDAANTSHPGVPRLIGEALASGNWQLAGVVESLCWLQRID